jgi:hypothetical protein
MEHAMGIYKLFRRKGCSVLCCVVPADSPTPGFLSAIVWDFMGGINTEASSVLTGFDEAAAELVIPLNGFYLFQEVV